MIPYLRFRLMPEETSMERILLRRTASLAEAREDVPAAANGPALAAADAEFWEEAALLADRWRAETAPGRFMN
jgi:hypothetical protein